MSDYDTDLIHFDAYSEPKILTWTKNFLKDVTVSTARALVTAPAFLFFALSIGLISLDRRLKNFHQRWRQELHNGIGDDLKASHEAKKGAADSCEENALEVVPPVSIEGKDESSTDEGESEESNEQSIQNSNTEDSFEEDDTSITEGECAQTPVPSSEESKAVNRSQRRGRSRNKRKA